MQTTELKSVLLSKADIAQIYTEPENGEDAYGVSIVDITACDGELGDVEIENEGDLDEAINGYTNTCEWS